MADETLHHYTTAGGLVGIVAAVRLGDIWEQSSEARELPRDRSFSLWATDARYLNDWGELDFAADALADAIERHSRAFDGDRLSYFDQLVLNLRNRDYTAVDWPAGSTHTAYVACFCENGDLLSQWQGYAANGGGYSIEFYVDALKEMWAPSFSSGREEFAYTQGALLHKVRYRLDESFIEGAAKEILEADPGLAMFGCVETLARFKNAAFEAECEWRAINVSPTASMYCQFRTTPAGRLVPYSRFLRLQHEFPFDPSKARSAIKSVTIGPGLDQKLRSEAVRQMLNQRGFTDVKIMVSGITYNP
ncbi:MAG: hypothetical protein JWR32_2222 [Mycobacterium sp.]|nr:hypothetical protein [Mycobacterium sp.]